MSYLSSTEPSLPTGLNEQEVSESRLKHGNNELTPPKRESLWVKFFQKFRDPMIIILLVAMVLSFGVSFHDYYSKGAGLHVFLEPLGVLLAVLLATTVSFYFEMRSEKEFALLNIVNDEVYYKVYRSGKLTEVLKKDIVVGDTLLLESGEEIPADALLLGSTSLQVDESSLTGEPMANKSCDPTHFDIHSTYPSNTIYRGTTILDGHCTARVTAVGDSTEYGKVFEGAQIDNSITTPLNRQLNKLASGISKVSYFLAALIIIGSTIIFTMRGGFQASSSSEILSFFLNKILVAVTIIVVAVPEGLPMAVSLSLAYSMRAMMKSNNLVRKMHACETMGAATVICTDKTGTLTQNQMSVATTLFTTEFRERSPLLAEALSVNTTANLSYNSEQKRYQSLGNPTEGALLLWLQSEGFDYAELRKESPILQQLTFSTERKYMATVVRSKQHDGKAVLYIKGAPEVLLNLCDIRDEEKEYYKGQLLSYQNKAMRTLGFAYKILGDEVPFEEVFRGGVLTLKALTFMGVVGIADPVRKDVPDAIRKCLEAGIDVKIVTGDTPGTATEIGRQIGLWDDATCSDYNRITGVEFEALSDEELLERVQSLKIMSRARPMDKERLVRLLQQKGEIVAVTGDGTNDAPALNKAHVGLSMGDGTSVAKEASDITILDNSFSSITQAVIWGRSLYKNIQRFIIFQMTINVVACITVLLGTFLGVETPLTVSQMLWVNLIMDTFAALALASLPPEVSVMKDKPRATEANIITKSMARQIVGVGVLFIALLMLFLQYFNAVEVTTLREVSFRSFIESFDALFSSEGSGLSAYELSLFFNLFVFFQFWNMFNAKAFATARSTFSGLSKAKSFILIAGIILLGQVFITTYGGEMFRVVPLELIDWGLLLLLTSAVLWVGEVGRAIFSR